MRIKELIQELKKQNPDELVFVRGYEGGFHAGIQPKQIEVKFRGPTPYEGEYEYSDLAGDNPSPVVTGLLLDEGVEQ